MTLRDLGTLLVTFLRSLRVVLADLYDIVSSGNLEALRKGTNMQLCTTEGCGQIAQLTVRREALEIPIDQDAVINLSGISVPVRAGETVTFPRDDRLVCEDCRDFLIALCGYKVVRVRSVI